MVTKFRERAPSGFGPKPWYGNNNIDGGFEDPLYKMICIDWNYIYTCRVIPVYKVMDKGRCYTLEKFLEGDWTKVSSNDGTCREVGERGQKLGALTHWVLHFTNYDATILDMQGRLRSHIMVQILLALLLYHAYFTALYSTRYTVGVGLFLSDVEIASREERWVILEISFISLQHSFSSALPTNIKLA